MKYTIRRLDSCVYYDWFMGDKYYIITYLVGGENVIVTFSKKYNDIWRVDADCAGWHWKLVTDKEFHVSHMSKTAIELAMHAKEFADEKRYEEWKETEKLLVEWLENRSVNFE